MTISVDERAGRAGRTPAHGPQPLVRAVQGGKAAGRTLSAILSILLGVVALASCAPGQPTGKAPTATPQATATAVVTPSATAVPRLVYQADWSHGLDGWTATPGWSVAGGALQSDMGRDREITSPFRPPTPDYAIELNLQIISVSQFPPTQYDLTTDPAASADGYVALFDDITLNNNGFFSHPHLQIYINPMVDQDLTKYHPHDFEPRTLLWTYRVEVRGPEAILLLNGHVANWARSIKTATLSTEPLHFSCSGVELRLSDFKVYAL